MKVLMFGWELPPHNSGGLGVACMGLISSLAKKGVEVVFVLPKKLDISIDNVKLIFADAEDGGRFKLPPTPYRTSGVVIDRKSKTLINDCGYLFDFVNNYTEKAEEIALGEDFDVIHAHDWLSFGAGLAAKNISGKPLVAHIHNTEYDRTGGTEGHPGVIALEKECFRQADKILSVSQHTKNIVVEKYGITPGKIEVVHNGIEYMEESGLKNLNLQKLKEGGHKIVLFLGRLTLHKGPDHFIQAAKKVLEYYPKALFIIAGSGEMEKQLIDDVSYSGLSDKIIFTGFLRGEERLAAFESADLFVLPSVSEPFGLTPLEALQLGTPVLISKQCGVGEILKHSLKVDFWDIDEMADKMISALEHGSLNSVLVENGRKEARAQTWSKAADKCLDVYKSLVHKFA